MHENITSILVDDEQASRETLMTILNRYCPEVQILAQAANMQEAYEQIHKFKPKLVFLDIEMPQGNAFTLLDKFDEISFNIVFTTAYKQYALEAIKVEALDYLLKPISINEVIQAVEKTKKKMRIPLKKNEIAQMSSSLQQAQQANPYLAISVSNGYEMILRDDIVRCEANESYTFLILKGGVKKIISKRLGDLESILAANDFFRIHHSHIVNRKHIKNYVRGEGGTVITDDDQEIPVSRRKKTEFLEWLTNFEEH